MPKKKNPFKGWANIWNLGIIHFPLSKTEKECVFPHLVKSAISDELLDGKIMHTNNYIHMTQCDMQQDPKDCI